MNEEGFKHNHEETEKLGTHFQSYAQKLNSSAGTHLGKANQHLGRTRGKGGLAAAAEQGAEKLMGSITKGQQALGKHLDDVGTGLHQTSANHKTHEEGLAKSLSGMGGKGAPAPAAPKSWASIAKGEGSSAPKPGPSAGGAPKPTPPKLRDNTADPKKTATPATARNTKSDPVDIASGEMLLPQTDVSLPGVLPLVLSRTHVSSYRSGGWFGASWASTLDQRLELDDDGVVFAAEDGMLLVYPVPQPGGRVEPVEGPRWPLHWDGTPSGGMRISDPHSGTSWHFAIPAQGPGPHARRSGALQLPLQAISDRNGNRIEVHYGPGGVPIEVRHGGGYRVGIDTDGRTVTALRLLATESTEAAPETDAAEAEAVQLVGFGYDGNGRLSAVTNSSGLAMQFTYDAAGRITSWTDRNRFRYRYLYDRAGRCVQTRGDGGFLDAVFSYDPENSTTTLTDSLGHRTVFDLDEHGRTVRETSPLGAVATTEWDRRGRLVSRTDPLGLTTRFGYDSDGNLAHSTLPDGTTSTAVHNAEHRIVELTALDGATWHYEYDLRGNLSGTTDPLGHRSRYAHSPLGHPAAVTDALGSTTRVATDPAGLPVSVTDPLGAVTTCVRDRFGRPQTTTDPLGGVTAYGWTVEGRPAWRVEPDGSRQEWRYDAEGNLVEHQDAAGGISRFEYTCFGRLAARTGPDGARYGFTYDTELRLTAVTGPDGAQWTYRYDAVGGLISETDFGGRTVGYTRDLAGQVTSRTNGAGQTVHYTLDAHGRTTELLADGQVTRFSRDGAGRILSARDADGELRYSYDPLGRTLTEEYNGAAVVSGYDPVGRRLLRRTPSGVESAWTYDAVGQPRTLTGQGGALRFDHDRAGHEIRREFGPAALTQTWNEVHRLTARQLAVAEQPVLRAGFDYRADGAVTGSTDSARGRRSYELDPQGRVTAVTGENWTERYAYDAAGNLTHAESAGSAGAAGSAGSAGSAEPTGADADGARLLERGLLRRAGRTGYEYDGQGRVVRRTTKLLSGTVRTWQYTWDSHDQLTSATLPDGTRWRYRYDPTGRRVAKQHLAADAETVLAETTYAWDGAQLVEQSHTEAGRPGRRISSWDWSVGGQVPLTQTEQIEQSALPGDASQAEIDRRFYAIVTDLVGAPSELVDGDGRIAWRSDTTLWGAAPDGPAPAVDCPLRFPGQYHDAETGLHYNVFRYYDPQAARYLSPDPLGLEAGANPYAYVTNPLTWADPLGLDPKILDLYHGTTKAGADNIVGKGIDPQFKPRRMDFGNGGFYVTKDRAQAEEWAHSMAKGRNGQAPGEPAVIHFKVPEDELNALKVRRFGDGDDQALANFIRHNRNGGRMTSDDVVEGKMLYNVPGFLRQNKPPRLGGHQMAFNTTAGADLLNSHIHEVRL
ncbi:RHS repeat-associated core domain-containing protein [Saccharothrix sp. ST-888]|uniref:RHS repeat-associated core domain-containing protein n=1 Tax=Saccharothrix sp. ST-888 TaxID=1427391 RepID=UPI0006960CBB|nr:RHS repeat-associated core domain-containing protein [Saccharothrix sp. ST-888]